MVLRGQADGYRALAIKTDGKVLLRSRNNKDFNSKYPSIAKALTALPDETVIDGEIVALEVHPLKDYGAVEIGTHRFLHPLSQDHGVVGEAKFIHVWQLRGGTWRITQVISYEHHVAQ